MAKQNDLRPVFERLKKIFAPYEKKMVIAQDTDTMYLINTRTLLKKNYPLMFGAVRLGKNYVSYHLLPLYMAPAGKFPIPPELKRRKQGKACFNFKEIDEKLFKDLAKLTKAGAKTFTDEKFIAGLRKMYERR